MGLISFFLNYFTGLQNNRLTQDRLLEIQEFRLRRLLRYAVQNSEFYRELYRGIDIDHGQLAGFPIITKSGMMTNFDRFITNSRIKLREIQSWLADENNYGRLYQGQFLPIPISGTSGEYGLMIYDRQARDFIQASLLARHPLQAKRSVYDQIRVLFSQVIGHKPRIAVIAVPHGNIGGMVITAPVLHHLFAKIKVLSLFDPNEQMVKKLNKFQPVWKQNLTGEPISGTDIVKLRPN